MLRQRPIQHKRKNSQLDLFYPSSNKSTEPKDMQKAKHKKTSNDKKLKLSLQQNNNQPNGKNILKLVQNSQRRANKKSTVIEDINQQNQWGNENIDSSNGAYVTHDNDQNNETYFQFGRRSRCSSVKKQNYDINYGYLNMEEITEVPDTMSNQRRYDSGNFYQFQTSNQNSLINFSNRLVDDKDGVETLDSQKVKDVNGLRLIDEPKNLKKRKQKLPKNVVIQGEEIEEKFDLSELSKLTKKSKLFFVNTKKDDKKSKSKQNLGRVQKDKSRSSLLFLTKKSKNLSQAALGVKKKSFSLKNETKNQLKIVEKKPKSFEKPKETSQTKSTHHLSTKPSKPSKTLLNQTLSNNPKNLQIGQKIMMIEQSQSKLQNQYKILWQCMGQLWENSRITRYISEKNKSDISKLKENEKGQDEKMIKLKSQILSSIASARY